MRGAACETLKSLWILLGGPERTASLEAWCRTAGVIEIRISCSITMHSNFLVEGSMAHLADSFQPLKNLCPTPAGVKQQEIPAGFWMQISIEADGVTKVISQTRHSISIMEMCLPPAGTC